MNSRFVTLASVALGIILAAFVPGWWKLIPIGSACLAGLLLYLWDRIAMAWWRLRGRIADWWESPMDSQAAALMVRRRRIAVAGLAGMTLQVVGLYEWRLAEARAQALRLVYSRQHLQHVVSERAYLAGALEVGGDVAKLDMETWPDPERPNRKFTLALIGATLQARQGTARHLAERVAWAYSTVPDRVWPWTQVADPQTTVTAPWKASPEALQPHSLVVVGVDLMKSHRARVATMAGSPGAKALPNRSEWEVSE